MNKYILPVIFLFLAIILSLCLTGFTLLKDSFLQKQEPTIGCAVVYPDSELPRRNLTKENLLRQKNGERLFNANCTTCHILGRKAVGPDLLDICQKYPSEEDKAWLFNWIRNGPKMIYIDKDPRAIALWEANDKKAMNFFPSLSDEDIRDILEYIQPGCYEK